MTKPFLIAVATALVAGAAQAQPAPAAPGGPPAPPPAQPRARGPSVALAVEAAQTAVATCLASGYKVTAAVVDSAGVPVVLLSGDGAPERTQGIAMTKIWATLKYKIASGEVAARAKTDSGLDAAIKADPRIGLARGGALPIMAGPDLIGAIAVSGAPDGGKDEVCTKAGLDKIQARLK